MGLITAITAPIGKNQFIPEIKLGTEGIDGKGIKEVASENRDSIASKKRLATVSRANRMYAGIFSKISSMSCKTVSIYSPSGTL